MKITLIMIETLNGFIHSKHLEGKPWWGSKEDILFFKKMTQAAGTMIFGYNTFLTMSKKVFNDRFGLIMVPDPENHKSEETDNIKFFSGTPEQAVKFLESIGKKEAILCGGGMINGQFIKASLIDEIYITIAPRLFGQGVRIFGDQLDFDVELNLLDFRKFTEDELLLHYKVIK